MDSLYWSCPEQHPCKQTVQSDCTTSISYCVCNGTCTCITSALYTPEVTSPINFISNPSSSVSLWSTGYAMYDTSLISKFVVHELSRIVSRVTVFLCD